MQSNEWLNRIKTACFVMWNYSPCISMKKLEKRYHLPSEQLQQWRDEWQSRWTNRRKDLNKFETFCTQTDLKVPDWLLKKHLPSQPHSQALNNSIKDLERWRDMKRNRPKCGAKRKYDGSPCQAPCFKREDGTVAKRCKLHGGASTGPKSAEGKAKALLNLKQNRQ